MSGRHRRGEPVDQRGPRRWDREQREVADRLDRAETGWLVMYGVGGRRFYAIAVGGEPLVVQAGTAEELCALMREAEETEAETHRHGQGDLMVAGTLDGLRTVCWDIPRDPATVAEARRMTRDVFTGWDLPPEFVDDAVLVVGELVANATVYGQEPIRLSLWSMAQGVCVRVTDHGPGWPRPLDLGQDASHGRGLAIVEALADRWGVVPVKGGGGAGRGGTGGRGGGGGDGGKTVWIAWEVPSGSGVSRTVDCVDLVSSSRLREGVDRPF
ncbi:ATP-binding protein [Streptosporangium sp. NPDC006930]|uniref:ATP-binding protein n=1 Tax=Streptosporangium sp. NPDC006930 TaxID=3154783 RepID=UPI003421DD0D